MAKKYKAVYLPDDPKPRLSKSGFKSAEEAEKYIASQRCDACKIYWDNSKECSCRAEWSIEEYDEKIY